MKESNRIYAKERECTRREEGSKKKKKRRRETNKKSMRKGKL